MESRTNFKPRHCEAASVSEQRSNPIRNWFRLDCFVCLRSQTFLAMTRYVMLVFFLVVFSSNLFADAQGTRLCGSPSAVAVSDMMAWPTGGGTICRNTGFGSATATGTCNGGTWSWTSTNGQVVAGRHHFHCNAVPGASPHQCSCQIMSIGGVPINTIRVAVRTTGIWNCSTASGTLCSEECVTVMRDDRGFLWDGTERRGMRQLIGQLPESELQIMCAGEPCPSGFTDITDRARLPVLLNRSYSCNAERGHREIVCSTQLEYCRMPNC